MTFDVTVDVDTLVDLARRPRIPNAQSSSRIADGARSSSTIESPSPSPSRATFEVNVDVTVKVGVAFTLPPEAL